MKWYSCILVALVCVSALIISCSSNINDPDQFAGKDKDILVTNINNKLHLDIKPDDIQVVFYTESLVNDEFKYPYTIYSKINCDSNLVKQIISKLKLESNKDRLIKDCNGSFLKFFGEEFWEISTYNARYTSSMYDKEKKIGWWKPTNDSSNENYYGFVNDTINTIPVSCQENWNGRVVLQKTPDGCLLLIDFVM